MGTEPASDVRRQLLDRPVPSLTILCHRDPGRVGERVMLAALLSGKPVELSRLEPRFAPPEGGGGRGLEDLRLSRRPFRLSPTPDDGILLDATATSTPLRVDGEPVGSTHRLTPDALTRGVVLLLAQRVVVLLRRTRQSTATFRRDGLIGESHAMVRVRQEIERVADLTCPVLLRGESGTGKELVARAIHDAGPRCEGPYLAVNVGAIPRELAPAELFGVARGAFTGADRKRDGYFQRAAGGTLFLDEIAEASSEVQVALLRVLESGQIQPVGAEKPHQVKVRVLAATDADLRAASRAGEFRTQLLHRLNSYQIHLPPLRDRREDFGRLFYHFLRRELAAVGEPQRLRPPGAKERPWVPAELVSRLALFDWPGNIRELRNVVRQLVVGNRGGDEMMLVPAVEELLQEAAQGAPARAAPEPYRSPSEISDEELLQALRAEHWNVSRTAKRLNVSRTTMYKLINDCTHIRKASELGREELEQARERCGDDVDAIAESLEMSPHGVRLRMRELGLH